MAVGEGSPEDFKRLTEFINEDIEDGMLSGKAADCLITLCIEIEPNCADWIGF